MSSISFVEYYQTYLRFGVGKFVDGMGTEWTGKHTIFNQNGSMTIEYIDRDDYLERLDREVESNDRKAKPYYK